MRLEHLLSGDVPFGPSATPYYILYMMRQMVIRTRHKGDVRKEQEQIREAMTQETDIIRQVVLPMLLAVV